MTTTIERSVPQVTGGTGMAPGTSIVESAVDRFRMAKAAQNGLKGFVTMERNKFALTGVQVDDWAIFDASSNLLVGYGMFTDPFAAACNTLKTYTDCRAVAVVFAPDADDMPCCLRETEGIVDSRDWQRFAIAHFQWEEDEARRREERELDTLKNNLKSAFWSALDNVGVPVDMEDICLDPTQLFDLENRRAGAEWMPWIDVDGLVFIHAYGDGRHVELLKSDGRDNLGLACLGEPYASDSINTHAMLGAALMGRQMAENR